MLDLKQARVFAPAIHARLFALIWFLHWVQPQRLFDGPSRYPFAIVFLADLPFSAFFFGVIFASAQRGPGDTHARLDRVNTVCNTLQRLQELPS